MRNRSEKPLLTSIETVGMNKSKMMVLEALLRLRQAACHPGLIDKSRAAESSAKLEALVEQLQDVLAEGHKALVFSQFTSFLALLRSRLDESKTTYEYLDGKTRAADFLSTPAAHLTVSPVQPTDSGAGGGGGGSATDSGTGGGGGADDSGAADAGTRHGLLDVACGCGSADALAALGAVLVLFAFRRAPCATGSSGHNPSCRCDPRPGSARVPRHRAPASRCSDKSSPRSPCTRSRRCAVAAAGPPRTHRVPGSGSSTRRGCGGRG